MHNGSTLQSEMRKKQLGRFTPDLLVDLLRSAPGNPHQVETENENSERHSHKKRAYPEAHVPMHPSPIRARIAQTVVAAVSLWIVPVTCHSFSNAVEFAHLPAACAQGC
jgi:hypothetical protein